MHELRTLASLLDVRLVQELEGYVVARSERAEEALGLSTSVGLEVALAELSGLSAGDPRIESLLQTARHDGRATVIVSHEGESFRLVAFRAEESSALFAAVVPTAAGARVSADPQAMATFRHEVANGLQGIAGLAALAVRHGDAGAEFLVDVLRRIERLATASVDAARNAGGRIFAREHEAAPHDELAASPALGLSEALRELVAELEPFAQERGVTLEARVHEGLVLPLRDSDLRSIVWNVVKNAVEATGTGGFVRLRAERTSAGVKLSVTDNGPGMDEQTRARALEPYFTTKPEGSGLGLPLVAHLIQRAGGSFSVESAPGRGTRFVAVFSVETARQPSASVSRTGARRRPRTHDELGYSGSGVRARPLRWLRVRLVGADAERLRPLLEAARAQELHSDDDHEAHVAFIATDAEPHAAAVQVAHARRAIAVGPEEATAPWALTVVSPEVALETLVAVIRAVVPPDEREAATGT